MPRRAPCVVVAVPATGPDDLDVTERDGLVELDEALLEQLEQGQEAHDDLDALDELAGELAEPDAPDAGQLVDQLFDGVEHGHPHDVDVGDLDRRAPAWGDARGGRRPAGRRGRRPRAGRA